MTFHPRDLEVPIVLAPLAGGPGTPALAIAVSEAGGLGFIGAGYRATDGVRSEIEAIRQATSRPFGVNLFVPGDATVDDVALRGYAELIAEEARRYGVAAGEPRRDDADWSAKLDLLVAQPVPVVSFTFGCPPREAISALRAAGSAVWITVTEVSEAVTAREAGADALVVQGVEAGGHRGSFVDRDRWSQVGVLPLLRLVANELELPMIAAGGIADGPGVAAVLAAGANAAQLGTAFLRTPEAGTAAAHRKALANPGRTSLTRSFTGRLARGLVNKFMEDHDAHAVQAYPHVHYLTAPLRAAARLRGDADMVNLWAGEAFSLSQEIPAGDLVRKLGADCRKALMDAAEQYGPTGV